jgi:hypothetical protein
MEESFRPPRDLAEEDWKNARRKVIYQKVVCAVTHCSVDMRSFEDVRNRLHLNEERYRGLEEIPLDRIRGSVGRYDDFTSTFLPRKGHMRERWQRVDKLVMEGKTPPIEVYQVDQSYFVIDGNHRVSTARQHGLKTIQAHVTEFQGPFPVDSEADIDTPLIEAERASFTEKVGESEAKSADEIVFTCAGCYRDLAGQVETYREGMTIAEGRPVSYEQAFSAWHGEVYSAAVEAIRQDDLLNLFPDRTEADLFIWAWQNSSVLEAEEG